VVRRAGAAAPVKRAARLALTPLLALLAGCVVVIADPTGLLRSEGLAERTLEGEGRDKIALVDVAGVISDRPGSAAFGLRETPSLLARVDGALRKAGEDPRVRAVVLRVDSPGGTVAASDALHARLLAFKHERGVPVIAALGGVATSGAYYVACAADTVIAQPGTVTGSIGVILVTFDASGLLGKIGVADATYTAGANKGLLSPLRAATPEQRRIVQDVLDAMHARFREVVAGRRPAISRQRMDTLADGRILVDGIGYLADAISLARESAGLKQARVVQYAPAGEGRQGIHASVPAWPDLGTVLGAAGLPDGAVPMYLWAPGLGP
jgi:protease IV